jgi:hypothetical protein
VFHRIPIGILARHIARITIARLSWRRAPSPFAYDDVIRGTVWACADVGGFARPLPRFPGVEGVVLMEDRHPQFFLSFREFAPEAPTGLDRHGPLNNWRTQQDLRDLVRGLRAQGMRVAIGFWNYGGWWPLPRAPWLRAHPELRRLPGSSDLDPFVRIHPEGIEYAEYIGRQYARLREAFGFDGLMLGDGFCGYSSFMLPDRFADRADAIPRWTDFYRTVAAWVHRSGGVLLAYDLMGFPYGDAKMHGVDYRALADAGLNVLVYQAYPQAWGGFWLAHHKDRFGLEACRANLVTVRGALAGTATRLFYTVELGDSVERWNAQPAKTQRAVDALDPLADGRFLVWANDLMAQRSG